MHDPYQRPRPQYNVGRSNNDDCCSDCEDIDCGNDCLGVPLVFVIGGFIIFTICLILLFASFGHIKEGELGLLKSNLTKVVSYERVYTPGYYYVGLNRGFEKVSSKVQYININEGEYAWTCPESVNGTCDHNEESNNVGVTLQIIFTIQYRILDSIEGLQQAYNRYKFNADAVAAHVKTTAQQNAKQTPQYFSLSEIIDEQKNGTSTDTLIDKAELDAELQSFGYMVEDILIERIELDGEAADKYLQTDLRRYEDDLVQKQEEAAVIRRETERQVTAINNEAVADSYVIEAVADAYVERLEAELSVYAKNANILATEALIDALHVAFNEASEVEIMEMMLVVQYIDQMMKIGPSSDTVFVDDRQNKLFVDQISRN